MGRAGADKNMRCAMATRRKSSASPAMRSGAASGAGHVGVDPLHRQAMIATAAYFRAERRGFSGGNPLDDWLQSEAEIDRQLGGRDAQ
jgi:hypothetical protein